MERVAIHYVTLLKYILCCFNREVGGMIGLYLSGTGNSKHCVEKFVQLLDENGRTFPIENPQVIEEIK